MEKDMNRNAPMRLMKYQEMLALVPEVTITEEKTTGSDSELKELIENLPEGTVISIRWEEGYYGE